MEERHTVDALRPGLDAGEAESIALALQIHADLVLMTERNGQRGAVFDRALVLAGEN